MAKEVYFCYQPIATSPAGVSDLTEIHGEKVPVDHPFRDGIVEEFTHLAIGGPLPKRPLFSKISVNHGRSAEFITGKSPHIFFADQYGNFYSSITTKGNVLEKKPKILKDETAPQGFTVWGMQDSYSIERVLKASDLLRKHGVETEYIMKVYVLESLPLNGHHVTIPELKKQLLSQVWKKNKKLTDEERNQEKHEPERADIPQISKYLDNCAFLITVRGMQSSERLRDLAATRTRKELNNFLKRVFRHANKQEDIKAEKDPTHKKMVFKPGISRSEKEFFLTRFPNNLGKNLATMHNLGLKHGYLHLANISPNGSIYDLDSVSGEALGDAKHSEKDLDSEALDLLISLQSFKELFLMVSNATLSDIFTNKVHLKAFLRFRDTYINSYIENREILKDFMNHIEFLKYLTYFSYTLESNTNPQIEMANSILENFNLSPDTNAIRVNVIKSFESRDFDALQAEDILNRKYARIDGEEEGEIYFKHLRIDPINYFSLNLIDYSYQDLEAFTTRMLFFMTAKRLDRYLLNAKLNRTENVKGKYTKKQIDDLCLFLGHAKTMEVLNSVTPEEKTRLKQGFILNIISQNPKRSAIELFSTVEQLVRENDKDLFIYFSRNEHCTVVKNSPIEKFLTELNKSGKKIQLHIENSKKSREMFKPNLKENEAAKIIFTDADVIGISVITGEFAMSDPSYFGYVAYDRKRKLKIRYAIETSLSKEKFLKSAGKLSLNNLFFVFDTAKT